MLKELIYSLKHPYHLLKTGLLKGVVAQRQYKSPQKKLKIIAITGTDGKTTTATLLYHLLTQAGKKVALLSTVAAYIGDEQLDTGFHVTSPNPKDLYRLMRSMVDQQIEYLILEATSHGIYQHRTWGIKPLITGVTNINHEHLDYHLTYANYLQAKAMLLKRSALAIINEDDQSAPALKKILRETGRTFVTYSLEDKLPSKVESAVKKQFSEAYNQSNSRLVYAISQKLSIPDQDFIKAIETFPGIPGRMEVVASKPVEVIVDFAHTPQALKAALLAIRKKMKARGRSGKLIAVYGCAGLRDRQKRPLMGQIGVELADLAVFTAEDPRTENVWSIIRQMKEKLTQGHQKIVTIANRGDAIAFALKKLAKKGDVVAIFGKGHERSMCYGTIEYPWSDQEAVKEILDRK